MAKVSIIVCDRCSTQIPDGEGFTVAVRNRKNEIMGSGDWCGDCITTIVGYIPPVKKRQYNRKSVQAAA